MSPSLSDQTDFFPILIFLDISLHLVLKTTPSVLSLRTPPQNSGEHLPTLSGFDQGYCFVHQPCGCWLPFRYPLLSLLLGQGGEPQALPLLASAPETELAEPTSVWKRHERRG